MRIHPTTRRLSLAFAALLLACGEQAQRTEPEPPPPQDQLTVRLAVEQDSMLLGTTRSFTATVTNQFDAPRTATVNWSTSNPAVLTVGTDGLVTAIGEGSAQVIASVTGSADTALVRVYGLPVSLQVFPEVVSLAVGDDFQLTTETENIAGSGTTPIQWSVSDSTVASISSEGIVTGMGEGDVTVTARFGTVAATASVGVFATPVASVSVNPTSATIPAGGKVDLDAVARSWTGKVLSGVTFAWSSSDPSVATVNEVGTVTGKARGFAVITASASGKKASATINVSAAPVASVRAQMSDSTLLEGQLLTASAAALDSAGHVINGLPVGWQSSNPGVATVTSAGAVSAIASGNATISAIIGGKVGSIPITVARRAATSLAIVPANPAVIVGGSSQLIGEVRDQNGVAMPGYTVTWSSVTASVAVVSSTGVLTGVSAGTSIIRATSGSFTATTTATVNAVPVNRVTVTPTSGRVVVGNTATLVATTLDAQGNVLPGRVITWTSSAPQVATVSPSGVVTAVAVGSAIITATSEGKSGTSTMVIDPVPAPTVATVSVTLNASQLNVGQSTQAAVQLRDVAGNVVTGVPVTWSSSDVTVAAVSSSGLVTAVGGGNVSITATAQGVNGGAALTVAASSALPVATVSITTNPGAIPAGATAATQVVLKDSVGTVLFGRSIGYSSSKTSVATVSASGVVTGVAAGTSYISATSGTVKGTSVIAVTSGAPVVTRVDVDAPVTSLQLGDTVRATATAYDASNATVGGLIWYWSSSDSSVAKVGTMGKITALSVGSATITAWAQGVAGTLGFTVVNAAPAPVANVSFTLNASALQVGQTTQGSAILRDASGNILTGRTVTYSSSNTAVATISSSGLVTAVSAGNATLTATSGGVSGSAALSVAASATVGSVSVTLTPSSIGAGQAASATALVRDTNGQLMTGQAVSWSIVNNGVASITNSGAITGSAAGTTTVSATVQGVSGSATLTVTGASPIQMPQLPRVVPVIPAAVLARPCTDRPATTAALQAAVSGSNKVICLPMGSTWVLNLDIPARAAGDTSWNVLRADSSFTTGVRVTGSERLPIIKPATTNQSVIHVHSRAAKWVFQGLEVTTDQALAKGPMALVFVGEFISERQLSDLPKDIHFSHMDVHGWLMQDTRRGWVLNGQSHVVRDSRCTEIHERNSDSQCVLSYNGPGPFLIDNNVLEAASENIMWGGGDPTIPGLVPCDITVRNNWIAKPAAWKSIGTPTQAGSYLIKLLYESKNSCRSLIEGNHFDGVWQDGQMGYAVWLKSVNQSGTCRWCRTTDVTFQNNTFKNVGAGFAFSGAPEQHPVDTALSRVLVTGNWIENINVQPYSGDSRPILLNVNARDVSFLRNTWTGGSFPKDAIIFDLTSGQKAVTNFRFEDNVIPTAQYGVGATAIGEGTVALNAGVGGTWTFLRNTFVGNQRNNYPVTTRFASTLSAALATGSGVAAPPVP